MSENLGFLAGRKGVEQSLFERVLQIAKQEGTPGSEQMRSLAKEFLFGDASVYGTASFYDFTREENKGVKVRLCNGSACLVAGTQPALRKSLEKTFPEFAAWAVVMRTAHFNIRGRITPANRMRRSDAS